MRMTEKPSFFGDTQNPNMIQGALWRRVELLVELLEYIERAALLAAT